MKVESYTIGTRTVVAGLHWSDLQAPTSRQFALDMRSAILQVGAAYGCLYAPSAESNAKSLGLVDYGDPDDIESAGDPGPGMAKNKALALGAIVASLYPNAITILPFPADIATAEERESGAIDWVVITTKDGSVVPTGDIVFRFLRDNGGDALIDALDAAAGFSMTFEGLSVHLVVNPEVADQWREHRAIRGGNLAISEGGWESLVEAVGKAPKTWVIRNLQPSNAPKYVAFFLLLAAIAGGGYFYHESTKPPPPQALTPEERAAMEWDRYVQCMTNPLMRVQNSFVAAQAEQSRLREEVETRGEDFVAAPIEPWFIPAYRAMHEWLGVRRGGWVVRTVRCSASTGCTTNLSSENVNVPHLIVLGFGVEMNQVSMSRDVKTAAVSGFPAIRTTQATPITPEAARHLDPEPYVQMRLAAFLPALDRSSQRAGWHLRDPQNVACPVPAARKGQGYPESLSFHSGSLSGDGSRILAYVLDELWQKRINVTSMTLSRIEGQATWSLEIEYVEAEI